ncbi:MAG TPA: hypothetical protein VGK40_07270 [Verrucomicrobiae bacterium]|jgi:hypothetical protein
MRAHLAVLLPALWLQVCLPAGAQVDPTRRELIQLGYNQSLQGQSPLPGYAFYYLNRPNYYRTNLTLRLAVAPVYLDSELGFSQAISPHTDFAIGFAGGGFADTYSEVRQGKFLKSESFTGHGGEVSASIYHRFNPAQEIPLHGILRGDAHLAVYERDDTTTTDFRLPDDRASFNVRTGLRWGGKEPSLMTPLAMELSAWYEGRFRTASDAYGFTGDRVVEANSHLFWARALLAYTLPELKHNFYVSMTAGTSLNADRFSAYRLGGVLPFISEFPLTLPGYFYGELTARSFVLVGGNYSLPLGHSKRWNLTAGAATAWTDYLPGLEQPGRWNSGIGGGISYRSSRDTWQILFGYAYGIDAIRTDGRGAHSVGLLLQFDLGRAKAGLFDPGQNPSRSRGLLRLLGGS